MDESHGAASWWRCTWTDPAWQHVACTEIFQWITEETFCWCRTPELSQSWISSLIVLSALTSCVDQPVLTTWPQAGTGPRASAVHRVFVHPLCNHLHHRVRGPTTTSCLPPARTVTRLNNVSHQRVGFTVLFQTSDCRSVTPYFS